MPRLPREAQLPAIAVVSVVVAILVVVLSPGSSSSGPAVAKNVQRNRSPAVNHPPKAPNPSPRRVTVTTRRTTTHPRPHPTSRQRGSAFSSGAHLSLARAVGQLIIGTYAGTAPPPLMLDAVRAGQLGAVILMGDNTADGAESVNGATRELQAAARNGGNPGLLIMTDQEGGEVKRLVDGPPSGSAAEMGAAGDAGDQGFQTGEFLKSVGINVDLAPVADVARVDGFIAQEARSFGSDPMLVADSACAFATGLARAGVAYTLKHFPGLGDAIRTTDNGPVQVTESLQDLATDDEAYGLCGSSPLALVMVSSASYASLTGSTPAVLSPTIYQQVMPHDGIDAVTISDSFESGAIEHLAAPALTAVNAGLDMVMYPGYESASAYAYQTLLADAEHGALSRSRVQAADQTILALKRTLGLA